MAVLRTLLGGVFLIFFMQYSLASTCTPHLAEKSSDKLIQEIEKLNPELLSGSKNPEQIYVELKLEEAGWIKSNGYIDYSRPLSGVQKQRILDHYKVNKEQLQTDYDYSLFYMNQLRLLYIRTSKLVYDRILSAAAGSVVKPAFRNYIKHIINSYFVHDLTSVELTAERFQSTMKESPWLFFPWLETIKILEAWEAQPLKGPRELDQFAFDIKAQYEGKLTVEQIDKIIHSLRARDAEKAICCKSGIGCQNCPLNRRFLTQPSSS